jgi:hypothetical protein
MKDNSVRDSLPVLTMPRLSSKLEAVADNLVRFALEFGIEVDDRAPGRLATNDQLAVADESSFLSGIERNIESAGQCLADVSANSPTLSP